MDLFCVECPGEKKQSDTHGRWPDAMRCDETPGHEIDGVSNRLGASVLMSDGTLAMY